MSLHRKKRVLSLNSTYLIIECVCVHTHIQQSNAKKRQHVDTESNTTQIISVSVVNTAPT